MLARVDQTHTNGIARGFCFSLFVIQLQRDSIIARPRNIHNRLCDSGFGSATR